MKSLILGFLLLISCPGLMAFDEEKCLINNPTAQKKGELTDLDTKLNTFTFKSACKLPFTEMIWNRIAPVPSHPLQLSNEEKKNLLLRFQKPGGMSKRFIPVLEGIIASHPTGTESDLLIGALQTLYAENISLYGQLQEKYPELSNLKWQNKPVLVCRSENDLSQINYPLEKYLTGLFGKVENFDQLEKELLPLAVLIKNLSPSQKEKWVENFRDLLTEKALVNDKKLLGVFESKISLFITQAINPLFDIPMKPLADLSVVQKRGMVSAMILGSAPIDNDTKFKNAYGFYMKEVPSLDVPADKTLKTSSYSWKMNGKNYTAKLEAQIPSGNNVVPEANSPDYSSLWKDKTLTGIVVAGSNLAEATKPTMNQYLAYYQGQGFEFQSQSGVIENFPQFLKEETESGRLDYLLKEAHTDGDFENLFRTNIKMRYELGIKKLPNGKTEKIQLVYPDPLDKKTTLLSNEEFASWIKNREKNSGGQFVYFNTSCWSDRKAINEIQAVESPLFLDIATTNKTNTFIFKEETAEYQLLQKFREGRNYDEIRSALSKDYKYRDGSGNGFIFPDEESYKGDITWNTMQMPKTKTTMTKDGKTYNFDGPLNE